MGNPVKLDLKKQLKHLYMPPSKEAVEIDVPEMQFAMIDGRIEQGVSPGESPQFAGCVGALFGISYTLKFVSKRHPDNPIDYTVMSLEGLWTTPAGGVDHATSDEWLFTLMILQPDHITEDMFEEARKHLRARRAKEGHPVAALEGVRLERFAEGLCVQIMHQGPYADELRSLETLGAYAAARGYTLTGPHHEIYLGDPRRARPETLKTVLRHAVVPAA